MTPSGETVCDFVPRERVVTALGRQDFEVADEYVSQTPEGDLSGAGCSVHVDDEKALTVLVDFMVSFDVTDFRNGLSDDQYHQLPDEAGLGYAWTEESGGPNVGHARMSYGDYVIKTRIVGVADDSEPEPQAVAMAQEVIHGLEIPDTWTLPGQPPSR